MAIVGDFVSVHNQTKDRVLASRVRVADTALSRLVGLLREKSLAPDSGLWIVPSNSIHTIGMKFRFDVILIDKTYRVVGLREAIKPFSMTFPNFKARSVLELPAYTISRSETSVGDQLRIETSWEAPPAWRGGC